MTTRPLEEEGLVVPGEGPELAQGRRFLFLTRSHSLSVTSS